jgi:hypothetical protein
MSRAALVVAVVLLLACVGGVHAQDAERLQIRYDAPNLSVQATDVPLVEVLRAIGGRLGFAVVESGRDSAPITLSVKAPVDEVLRRLLKTENHTILYRRDAAGAALIDRIVLLGRPGPAPPPERAVAVPAPAPAAAPPTSGAPTAVAPPVAGTPPASPPLSRAPAAAAPPPASPAASAGDATESGTAQERAMSVGDLLRTHAVGVMPEASGSEPARPVVPATLEDELAAATRRAQENLTTLVEGLEQATRALQQQQR